MTFVKIDDIVKKLLEQMRIAAICRLQVLQVND